MYDLAIVGSGWAGFNAALKARELGLKVCLIEKARIGGTCLNYGCIPTKTLIQSAKIFSLIKKADIFGLKSLNPEIDLARIQERKDKIIQQLSKGMQAMLGGIDFLNAEAKIIADDKLKVGDQTVDTKFILIATGSRSIELGYFKFDAKRIISSDDILNLKEIPDSLLIVGAGAIGCEFASLFSTLGSKVTMVEKMPQLIPGLDNEVARKIELIFKKKGISINTNTDAATLDLKNYSLILVCVGRVPRLEGLGLDTIGVNLEKGTVPVNEHLMTNIDNIYAAGDCTGGAMLAHFAAYQGNLAAENIARPRSPKKADNKNIP
ncbi:MAG: FAD-dependent oxidoreductase, partial [Candidatus Omnitrophica bacterium]|nr:FAD-dependent oxidoreductase [Candidatus Omnitrophota bacterium]